MKLKILFLLILIIPNVYAINDYTKSDSLTINLDLNSVIEASGSTDLSSLTANIFLVPLTDDMQSLQNIELLSSPPAQISEDYPLNFKWTSFSPKYELGYSSQIRTKNKLYQVPKIGYW